MFIEAEDGISPRKADAPLVAVIYKRERKEKHKKSGIIQIVGSGTKGKMNTQIIPRQYKCTKKKPQYKWIRKSHNTNSSKSKGNQG